MKARLFLSFLILASAPYGLFAHQDAPKITYKATEVGKGLYMLEGQGGFAGGNLGLLVGEDGVILIDDGLPPLAETMKAAIAKLTKSSVDFVINTHVHGDHTGGNVAMTEAGATIVAHDNIRAHMVAKGVPSGNGTVPAPKDALPVITFSDQVSFHLNGQQAKVIHVPHGHTDGDAFIHFTGLNVIHTGDMMFHGLFPFIDLDSGGSVNGYISGQKKILSLADDNTKIIPGHGPLASKADLQAAVDMLEDAKALVATMVKAGKSEDEVVAANPLVKYHEKWNWGFITTERMTRTLVRGLSK